MTQTSLHQLTVDQEKYRKRMLKPWMFRTFLFGKIPMGWLSGMKVVELGASEATTTVGYRWLNQNPFRSMYFAVQGMAAELATGSMALLAMEGQKVAGIITSMDAEFFKKASSKVYFTCQDGNALFAAVEKCKISDDQITVKMKSVGKTKDGTTVSIFHFTWSFKRRS